MIFYGTKAVHVKTAKSNTSTCENCASQGTINMSVFRKHAHLYWIPLFPIGKVGASECSNCKNVLENKEMTGILKKDYDTLAEDAKGPIWQFAGVGLLVLIGIFGYFASKANAKQELEYLRAPAVGDVYEQKLATKSYSTFKITSLSEDSVFVCPNEYEISKITKIHKIDKAENYADFSYGIAKEDLKGMYELGEVVGINR